MQHERRVAVIGSNSFSGSDFVDHLLDAPRTRVLGISRSAEKGTVFLPYLQRAPDSYQFIQADLNNDMQRIMAELDAFAPQYIVNFAAQSEVGPSWQHPEHWFQTNTVALAKLIDALKDRSYLERYVHISSPEAYGTCIGTVYEDAPLNPSTPYAASKAAADLLLQSYQKALHFPVVTVRSTNVYGAHQQLFKIIPRSFIRLRQGGTIDLHGGGVAVKSFIHIRDVSRGEEAIMEQGHIGKIYHLSPDHGYSVREVVQHICDLMGEDFTQRTKTVADRLGQDAAYVIDSTKARTQLGWRPRYSLEQGLRETMTWIEKYWDDIARLPHEYVHTA